VINLTPTPFSGGSRVIQHGLIEPSTSFKIFSSLYIAGIAIGLYFTLLRGIWVLIILSIGVFISYFYSAKPLRFAEKGLGEIMVGIGFGPIITLGSYVAMTGKLSLIPLLVSIPIGTLIALILYVNEIPDREWDIKAGKLTLVARMKKEKIAKGYLIGIIITYLSYVLCLFLRALPIYSLLVLALLPLTIKVYKGIKSGYHDPYSMIPVCATHISFYIYFALLVLLSLILNLMSVNLPL
jgi:1,4-dihydroxy-2-naphthoate octaprenyltransferase